MFTFVHFVFVLLKCSYITYFLWFPSLVCWIVHHQTTPELTCRWTQSLIYRCRSLLACLIQSRLQITFQTCPMRLTIRGSILWSETTQSAPLNWMLFKRQSTGKMPQNYGFFLLCFLELSCSNVACSKLPLCSRRVDCTVFSSSFYQLRHQHKKVMEQAEVTISKCNYNMSN